ncbi:hypothetical protein ITI46_08800 [Streptomyces oryzae]|uniref:Uncharacterized protein n=1 Tax=Streptomyces oryzae TaxID=1434886 RepID=A0ABS3X8T8_9ACTN|nr:hypothetical protein [Streptomyces oryzae]MBO8191777.1 hypothetical protein [Streptomyces oryzae]
MGFDLAGVFTLDAEVFALFDVVIPGGSGHALQTRGSGLPDGWLLPDPWELEYGTGGRLAVDEAALQPADPDAWRVAAAVPGEADPLDAFDASDHRLGSFLSLAAPVLLVSDSTFGGVLGHEHAALFVNGELLTARGVDHHARVAFRWEDGAFSTVRHGGISPVAECAAVLDGRFRGRCLFDGYLPREAHREGSACRQAWSGTAPRVDAVWHRHFPGLLHHRS